MIRAKKVASRPSKWDQVEASNSALVAAIEEISTHLVPSVPIFQEIHFQEMFTRLRAKRFNQSCKVD